MGSGKTTVANALMKLYAPMHRASFAEPVKAITDLLLDMAEIPPGKEERRKYYVVTGQMGRTFWNDIWLQTMLSRTYQPGALVCEDVRFENEASTLHDKGWLVYRLNASEKTRVERMTTRDGGVDMKQMDAASEVSVDLIATMNGDFQNETPADLREVLEIIVEDIRSAFAVDPVCTVDEAIL